MSLSEWYIRRPIATSLLMVGLLVLGSTAYTLLPVAALPDALAGHRLAGISGSGGAQAVLAELGVNPLIVDAFHDSNPKAA